MEIDKLPLNTKKSMAYDAIKQVEIWTAQLKQLNSAINAEESKTAKVEPAVSDPAESQPTE